MSEYYKIPRHKDWNYIPGVQNNFKLSRSKIELFINCPRCFYIDNRLGIKQPPGYPFTLNSAVDALLKKEFDYYRELQKPHPIMTTNNLDAVPFQHEKMDFWRDALRGGVQVDHKPTNLLITGGVDDIWQSPQKELIVADYKATSKEEEITSLDKEWQAGYKRQAEIYQWLLRENGFTVNAAAYFVYANGDANKDGQEAFNNTLTFDTRLIPYEGNADWVEPTIMDIKACLESSEIPQTGEDCDYCRYREAVEVVTNT